MLRSTAVISMLLLLFVSVQSAPEADMFAVNYDPNPGDEEPINFDALMKVCNASFTISMPYLNEFKNTGQFSDTTDKTGMCYMRCMWEKSGLINDWKLNANKVRANIWPATGDSLDVCAREGMNEENDCVHLYMIAKCLMMRALTDAPNKPTV